MENNETNELNNKLEIYNRIKEKLQEIVRNKTNLEKQTKINARRQRIYQNNSSSITMHQRDMQEIFPLRGGKSWKPGIFFQEREQMSLKTMKI